MQQLPTKQHNDGFVRIDNRSMGNFTVKTASYAMTDYDCGDIMSNRGAAGSVTFTLPTAPKEGRVARFAKEAQQTFVISAAGSGFKINTGAANGTYTNSAAENLKYVALVFNGVDTWLLLDTNGTWVTA